MHSSTRAPGYDLFKLIVAIILLFLSIILMWASPAQSPVPISTPLSSIETMPATPQPTPSGQRVDTALPLSTPTQGEIVSTSPIPTSLAATASPIPSPTKTNSSEPTPTPLPSPIEPPVTEVTTTPTTGTPAATACEAANSRSRLQTGTNAMIRRRLNFRSSPGIRDNWLLTNMPGTPVEVVGGPECIPYWTGAYVWWQIKLPDGRIGWSAEGSQHGSFYFMEPSP